MTAPHPWDWSTALALILVHVGALFAPWFFDWSALAIGVVLYLASGLGVTLGYHRLLAHRSFRTPLWLEYLLVAAGSLACQGGPVGWTAVHRMHHANADRPGDPHNARDSFWWAHMGWLFRQPPHKLDPAVRRRMANDLEQHGFYRWLDATFVFNALALGWLLGALGGWPWVFWGMFVRLTVVFHATWLVNSAAHTFGYRPFDTPDRSTNCWWVAWLTFGEGWHNTHHAHPSSARHGLGRWEFDAAYAAIRLLERVGLAWDVKLAAQAAGSPRP